MVKWRHLIWFSAQKGRKPGFQKPPLQAGLLVLCQFLASCQNMDLGALAISQDKNSSHKIYCWALCERLNSSEQSFGEKHHIYNKFCFLFNYLGCFWWLFYVLDYFISMWMLSLQTGGFSLTPTESPWNFGLLKCHSTSIAREMSHYHGLVWPHQLDLDRRTIVGSWVMSGADGKPWTMVS